MDLANFEKVKVHMLLD